MRMARQESDRDDLFAELAALSPRVELRVGDSADAVCAGRRESTGGWSVFFGPDRVYHFDASGRLRRAYVEGFLYRSEGSTLSRLQRERSAARTTLLRQDLQPEELQTFFTEMRFWLGNLVAQIKSGQLRVVRQTPEHEDVLSEIATAFERPLTADPPLAPAIRG